MGTLHGLSSRENGTEPISLSIRPNQKKMLQTDVFIGQANTNENNAQQYSYEDGDLREKWYGKIRQRQKIEGAHISRQKVRGKGNVAYYAKGGWKWSYWIHDYIR